MESKPRWGAIWPMPLVLSHLQWKGSCALFEILLHLVFACLDPVIIGTVYNWYGFKYSKKEEIIETRKQVREIKSCHPTVVSLLRVGYVFLFSWLKWSHRPILNHFAVLKTFVHVHLWTEILRWTWLLFGSDSASHVIISGWLHESQGMAQIASQGDAGQTSGSGIEDHGKELKITAAFAYWSGGLSFAASIAIIGARAGSSSDNTKAHAVNIIAIFMVCTFILSVLLLVVMRVLPVDDSSPARARRAFARTTMALILCLLTVAIILGPTLLF